MISGRFATGKFGGSMDYKKNKVLVIVAWIFYILMSIGFFGIAIYENFFVEH